MNNYHAAGAVAMRVGVFFGGTAMCGPARMSYSVGAIEWAQADNLFEVAKFAFRAPYLQVVAFVNNRNAGGVVAAIFEFT
jgi:hypothetical protein